jgi:hypothetical protein
MCGKVEASGVIMIVVILLITATVSGCSGQITPAPTLTPTPTRTPTLTPNPAQISNETYTVLDYSLDTPQYNTTLPLEMKTHKGNYSLYGKITVNGAVPPGYVYHLMPSKYRVSESNEAVDTIGILEVSSVSMSYSSSFDNRAGRGSSEVTLWSFVDPQGNYRINGLNPGQMILSEFRSFSAPGGRDRSYQMGLIHINLTKEVSRCDLDLTDVEFEMHTGDGLDLYTCTVNLKNTDL